MASKKDLKRKIRKQDKYIDMLETSEIEAWLKVRELEAELERLRRQPLTTPWSPPAPPFKITSTDVLGPIISQVAETALKQVKGYLGNVSSLGEPVGD